MWLLFVEGMWKWAAAVVGPGCHSHYTRGSLSHFVRWVNGPLWEFGDVASHLKRWKFWYFASSSPGPRGGKDQGRRPRQENKKKRKVFKFTVTIGRNQEVQVNCLHPPNPPRWLEASLGAPSASQHTVWHVGVTVWAINLLLNVLGPYAYNNKLKCRVKIW